MAGRPKFEITPEIMDKVESYAAQGLTQEQIARCLGICYQTLNERKKEYSEFSEAIKRGQAKGLATISNALFIAGKGGNITAQIFYLKNRQPDEWRDRREFEHTGKGGKAIEFSWTVEIVEPDHEEESASE